MNNKILILASLSACALGALYLMITQDWIMFRYPSYKKEAHNTALALRAHKQTVQLFFLNNNTWNHETVEVLETNDTSETTKHLVNAWLTLLDENQIMKKKISLQSALVSPNKHLYLSFDRNPFNKQDSTHKKWMWIESLLKTIRENKIPLQSVRLLVHHQPLEDYHLDFSRSWPLSGFLIESL